MRAFAVRSFGEAPAIHDLPIPAADGGFLIHVRYAGANPIDYKLDERLTANSAFPFVVGVDFAGVVQRVPSGEPDLRAGDRVFGMARTARTPSTPRSHRECRQKRWPVSPTASLTNRQPRCPSRQSLRSGQSTCCVSPLSSESLSWGQPAGWVATRAHLARTSSRPSAATSTELADSAPTRSTTPRRRTSSRRFPRFTPRASKRSSISSTTRTPSAVTPRFLRPAAASSRLFTRQTKAGLPSATSRRTTFRRPPIPLSSRQGLSEVAGMLADQTITARITSTIKLDGAGQLRDRLRKTGLHGKAVIRL
jgi:hypothetical protein